MHAASRRNCGGRGPARSCAVVQFATGTNRQEGLKERVLSATPAAASLRSRARSRSAPVRPRLSTSCGVRANRSVAMAGRPMVAPGFPPVATLARPCTSYRRRRSSLRRCRALDRHAARVGFQGSAFLAPTTSYTGISAKFPSLGAEPHAVLSSAIVRPVIWLQSDVILPSMTKLTEPDTSAMGPKLPSML